MESLKSTFSNKYVLFGGLAIGAIILAGNMFSSHTGSQDAGQAYNNSGVSGNSQYITSAMAYNTMAAQEVTKQAAIAGQVAIAKAQDNVQLHVSTMSAITAIDAHAADVQKQSLISYQGIMQSQITTAGAVAIDQSNNTARLFEAQQQTSQVIAQSNAAVDVAHYQAKAAKASAKWGALGSIAGTLGKTVAAFA